MNPAIMRMVVDLPAPLAPRKPSTSPGATEKRQVIDGQFVAVAFGEIFRRDHGRL